MMSAEKLVVDGAEVTEEELRFLHEWSGQPHAGILKSDIKRGYVTALKVIRLHRTLAGLRADVDRLLSADRATAKVLCDPETGLLAKVAMLLERDRATTNRLRRDEERIAALEEQYRQLGGQVDAMSDVDRKRFEALDEFKAAMAADVLQAETRIAALEAKSHSHGLPPKAEWYEQMVAEHGMHPDDAAVAALQRGCDDTSPEPPDVVAMLERTIAGLQEGNTKLQARIAELEAARGLFTQSACRALLEWYAQRCNAVARAQLERGGTRHSVAVDEAMLLEAVVRRLQGQSPWGYLSNLWELEKKYGITPPSMPEVIAEIEAAPQAAIDVAAHLEELAGIIDIGTDEGKTSRAALHVAANALRESGGDTITAPYAPGTLDEAFAEAEREGWRIYLDDTVSSNTCCAVIHAGGRIHCHHAATPQSAARAALDAAKEASDRG